MKQLIVTADDFGYSSNVNRAIIECFRKGIVTSTSLLVNTKYFDESARLLKENNLDTGIHINLTEFKPLTKAKTLIDKNECFFNKNKWIAGHYKNANENKIENEIEAQILKALSSGLKITHINGHNHIHIFPKVIDAAVKLAKKYKIKYVRVPYEKSKAENEMTSIISGFLKMAKSKILKNKLKATNAFYGILDMHDINFYKLSTIINSIKNGTNELMVHPAYIDRKGDIFHQSTQREKEIQLLTNNRVKQLIKERRIKLTGFSQI